MFDLSLPIPPTHAAPPVQQTTVYAKAARLLGARAETLILPDATATVMRRRLPLLGQVAMISRGPVWSASGNPAGVFRDLRNHLGAQHLIIHADAAEDAMHLRAAGYRRVCAGEKVADLSLAGRPQDWASRMQGKWRNRLRHGLRHPITVRRQVFPADPRHWLFTADTAQGQRHGYRPMPPVMVAALAATTPGAVQLFTAFRGDHPIAAMLFIRAGRRAVYQIGWSGAEGRTTSANNLLLWHAMLGLHQLGVEVIELGIADPEKFPGLAHFKSGAGADLRKTGGTWVDTALWPQIGRWTGGRRGPTASWPTTALSRVQRLQGCVIARDGHT